MPTHRTTTERPEPRWPLDPVGRDGRRLADEAEAFLAGRLVDHLTAAGRPVPAWAVLNELAHASPDELAAFSASPGPKDEPHWRQAQRELATGLLECAATPADVRPLQEAVLIPLELWFAERSRHEAVSARTVVDTACDVLATVTPPSATTLATTRIPTGGHPDVD